MEDNTKKAAFDPLDMNNYKVEKLPKMEKTGFEKWMARLGAPLALIAFVFIYWGCHIGFIDNLDTTALAAKPPRGWAKSDWMPSCAAITQCSRFLSLPLSCG